MAMCWVEKTWNLRQRALSIRPKISGLHFRKFPVANEPSFSTISEKGTTAWAISKFSKISYREFLFHLIFNPEFQEFSVEWLAFRKFNNFRILRKLSKEISRPFGPISKGPEFLVEWEAPQSFIFPEQIYCSVLVQTNRNQRIFRNYFSSIEIYVYVDGRVKTLTTEWLSVKR